MKGEQFTEKRSNSNSYLIGNMALGSITNLDDNSDEKRLMCNESTSTSGSDHLNRSTLTVSEHHVGQFTIIRSLEERERSLCFSDLVIKNENNTFENHDELFNDLETGEDVHRKTSKTAKLGVTLVILMIIIMIVIVVYCVLSSPRNPAGSTNVVFKDKNERNVTTET